MLCNNFGKKIAEVLSNSNSSIERCSYPTSFLRIDQTVVIKKIQETSPCVGIHLYARIGRMNAHILLQYTNWKIKDGSIYAIVYCSIEYNSNKEINLWSMRGLSVWFVMGIGWVLLRKSIWLAQLFFRIDTVFPLI